MMTFTAPGLAEPLAVIDISDNGTALSATVQLASDPNLSFYYAGTNFSHQQNPGRAGDFSDSALTSLSGTSPSQLDLFTYAYNSQSAVVPSNAAFGAYGVSTAVAPEPGRSD